MFSKAGVNNNSEGRWRGVFEEKPAFEWKMPVSEQVVEVKRHYRGGVLWWELLIELVFNGALFFLTVFIAERMDPWFSLVWIVLTLPVLLFAGHKVGFQLFKRRPSRDVATFEGAEVPSELIERYTKARDEFDAVIAELNALPSTR